MAGKTLDSRAPVDLDTLKAKVQQRYTGVLFDVPGYDVTVELAMLKRSEREEVIAACRRADGTWDGLLQDRLAAAFGLINPKLTAEDLRDYPDDFIEPIAAKVWELSNAYREGRETHGTGPHPFPKVSLSPARSETDSANGQANI